MKSRMNPCFQDFFYSFNHEFNGAPAETTNRYSYLGTSFYFIGPIGVLKVMS
jgi:hypothetical protein